MLIKDSATNLSPTVLAFDHQLVVQIYPELNVFFLSWLEPTKSQCV